MPSGIASTNAVSPTALTFSVNASTKGLLMPLMTLQEEDHVIKGLVLRIKMMVQDVAEDQTDRAYLLDELAERLLTEADKLSGYVK